MVFQVLECFDIVVHYSQIEMRYLFSLVFTKTDMRLPIQELGGGSEFWQHSSGVLVWYELPHLAVVAAFE